MGMDGRPERRRDQVSADIVDVGLIYIAVFGPSHGLSYFKCTIVQPHVYCRVVLGERRSRRPVDDSGMMALSD